MKRLTAVLMAALLLGALWGCGGAAATYTEADTSITAQVDEQFVIVLEANPTTGYQWMASYDNGALELVDNEYQANEQAEGMVGGGGHSHFTFKALKAGSHKITMTYKRSWETSGDETGQEFTVTVN